MKIIEKKDWTTDFKWAFTCPTCESKLEAESDDLNHKKGGGVTHDSWPESFHVVCLVCTQHVNVPTNDIPKYIQKLARLRAGRSFDPYR